MNAGRALRFVAWGMLALWTFLGLDRPIGDGDESMHAEILRQMIRSGDYLHTRWYGVVLHERPPLIYWLAVPFAQLWSSEIGVRLSSALMSYATLLLVYRIASRVWLQPTAALTACILLAAAPSYHVYTRTLMSEAPYLLALTVALWGAIEAQSQPRGLLLAAAGLGAAVAVKSLAAALPLLALAPWLAHAQHKHGNRRSTLSAIGVFVALAAPFFLLGFIADPQQFLREHIGFHLLQRAQGGTLGMTGGLWAYASSIPYRDGPWITALLVTSVVAGFILGARRERSMLLLSGYAVLFFIGISLIGTRLPHYILPLYPAAALAGAGALARASKHLQRPIWQIVAPMLASCILLASLPYSGGSDALFERPFGKILGQHARTLRREERLYVYEWYGLSLGYYAQSQVVLLTAQPERYRSINFPMGAIARAHAAALVPPLPAAEGTSIVIAGHVTDLDHANWFKVDDILAAAPPYFLARATVHALPAAQATLTPRVTPP